MHNPPVITIDGPAGAGKGTLVNAVANQLNWHRLDSGALYRLTALAALQQNIPLDDENALAETAANLPASFTQYDIYLAGECVTQAIRQESCGNAASKVAAFAKVRQALLQRQRDYQQAPGLVADGRDMGTVVFPDALIKIFLTASAEKRAERRFLQLQESTPHVTLERLVREIKERDQRDQERAINPLIPADNAIIIDSSDLTITEVTNKVMEIVNAKLFSAKKAP